MLVSYRTARWSGTISDQAGAKAAALAAGAQPSAYRVGKNLMDGADERLKQVSSIQEYGRRVHQMMTLPWAMGDSKRGPRLLATEQWHEYASTIGKIKHDYKQALNEFLVHYEDDKELARQRLNIDEAAAARLYPPKEQIEKHFSVSIEFAPIPAGAQFTGLPAGVAEQLEQTYERQFKERIDHARSDAMSRVKEHLESLVNNLSQDQPHVKRATLERIGDVGKLVGSFALLAGPEAREVAAKCKTLAEGYTHTELNKKKPSQEAATAEAKEILDKLSYWGL